MFDNRDQQAMNRVAMQARFLSLLKQGSRELFEDNADKMKVPNLLPTENMIAEDDLRLFFLGCQAGLITLERGARFNTLDRPRAGGRWGLLSRTKDGGWYNAEYLPQIASYVHAIAELGYPSERVLFELPDQALKLDLAILNDEGKVIVVGEAKRALLMLDNLLNEVLQHYREVDPGSEGRNESRQLAWRLWRTRAPFLWLIGPGERRAYKLSYGPINFERIPRLPAASDIGLGSPPARHLGIPNLRKESNAA
jgi:hypothetical protein